MGMGLTPKTNNTTTISSSTTSTSSESWGRMGFLFIFFPEDHSNDLNKKPNNNFSISSSSSFKSCNSNSTHLLSRAQSTISICALLIFITLLLFTLSTFEPTTPHHYHHPTSRRNLISIHKQKPSLLKLGSLSFPHALQGMGSLYRRGTRGMNDLIVAHVTESVTEHELKLFLRLCYRSGIASKSDILFMFSSKKFSFDNAIVEENSVFAKQNHTQFVISSKKEKESGEPIWGRKLKSGNFSEENVTESTRLSYGSVVGFDVDELDPENSLSGFLDHVPLSLRRWACYPMLLGRVRRNYKHIMLVDLKEYLVVGDPLGRVAKNQSPESVLVTMLPVPTRKRNVDKNHQKQASPGIILGGARGVRRLANAVLTEIVRVAMQHKKKNSVSESGIFNQLVTNEFILKNVNVIISGDTIPELSSLNSKSGFNNNSNKFPIIRRGNSNLDINNSPVLKKYLCSSPLDSKFYSDC